MLVTQSSAGRRRATATADYLRFARVVIKDNREITIIHGIWTLRKVLGLDFVDAAQLIAAARRTGSAVCITEPLEHAEFHCDRLNAFELPARMEETESA